jgi:hypothetical protein
MGISSPCVHFESVYLPGGFLEMRAGFWSFTDECDKHLCLRGSRFANQVIHQGDGPKLPHQAVVMRQSAIYRKGRNAVDTAGGVVPRTGFRTGPHICFLR